MFHAISPGRSWCRSQPALPLRLRIQAASPSDASWSTRPRVANRCCHSVVVCLAVQCAHGPTGSLRDRYVVPGPPMLIVRAIGSRAVAIRFQFDSNMTTPMTVRLAAVTQTLDSLSVTVRSLALEPFEQRRAKGMGSVIAAEEMNETHPITVSQFLRRLPVLTVMELDGVTRAVSTLGRKLATVHGQVVAVPCVMRIALDGHLLAEGTTLDCRSPNERYSRHPQDVPSRCPRLSCAGLRSGGTRGGNRNGVPHHRAYGGGASMTSSSLSECSRGYRCRGPCVPRVTVLDKRRRRLRTANPAMGCTRPRGHTAASRRG